jgi:hypothetical protein
MFAAVVSEFESRGWFQEFFGYDCADAGFVPARLGQDIEGALFIETGRPKLWPVTLHAASWDEDTLFDMVEFLYRCVGVGIKESGRLHSFAGCGWHFNSFDQRTGRREYRAKINRILGRYGAGFELTDAGHVERRLPEQVAELAPTPLGAELDDEVHVAEAVRKYKSRVGLDRRDAVRDLADVLEHLRPKVTEHMFSKDEASLFQIANQLVGLAVPLIPRVDSAGTAAVRAQPQPRYVTGERLPLRTSLNSALQESRSRSGSEGRDMTAITPRSACSTDGHGKLCYRVEETPFMLSGLKPVRREYAHLH